MYTHTHTPGLNLKGGPPVEIAFTTDKLDQPKTTLSIVSDYHNEVNQDSIISSIQSGLLGNVRIWDRVLLVRM